MADKDRNLVTLAVPLALGALAIGVVVYFLIEAPEEHAIGSGADETTDQSDAGLEEGGELPPRCQTVGGKPYRIGKASGPAPADGDEDIEPFAVEVGRSVTLKDGYAIGVRHDQDKGAPIAEVALLDVRAEQGKLVSLGRSRGDMDPPIVRRRNGSWAASMLEPNAGGLALKLAGFTGGKVEWGAELEQGADESLAYDLAFNGKTGVVAWDDVTKDGKRGRIMLATVDADLGARGEPAEVSGDSIDADQPRLMPRKNGFWLAYTARSRERKPERESDAGEEARFAAERIEPSWIELAPLDASGKVESAPRAVTPKEGFVLAFDLELGREGGALLAWRDDDTPTGASGGRISIMLVSASGATQQQPVEAEEVGAGVPVLLPGWLAVGDAEGRSYLAPLAADGVLEGELRREPLIGRGQVLAARDNDILVARPMGRAVELSVLRCTRVKAADAGTREPEPVEPAPEEEEQP